MFSGEESERPNRCCVEHESGSGSSTGGWPMTERDPIESLEAADGLPVAPSPEFEEELRIVLDLRLRVATPDASVDDGGGADDVTRSRHRRDWFTFGAVAIACLLALLTLVLVVYLALWVASEDEPPEAPARATTTASSVVPESSATGDTVESLLRDAGCRVTGDRENPHIDCGGVDLSYTILDGAALPGANFAGSQMVGVSLAGADLTGAVFNGAWLYAADFTGADLSDAELIGADLNDARLVDVDLSRSVIENTFLTGADLTRVKLHEARLLDVILYEADLTDADLTAASLTQVDLAFATVRGIVLHDAKLSRMELFHLDFTGADFSGLQVAAEWFAVTCPDSSPQGVRESIPCGLTE